jgi:hypothetical protein
MSKANASTLVRPIEWAKHLRKWGKRIQAKKERRAGIKLIRKEG